MKPIILKHAGNERFKELTQNTFPQEKIKCKIEGKDLLVEKAEFSQSFLKITPCFPIDKLEEFAHFLMNSPSLDSIKQAAKGVMSFDKSLNPPEDYGDISVFAKIKHKIFNLNFENKDDVLKSIGKAARFLRKRKNITHIAAITIDHDKLQFHYSLDRVLYSINRINDVSEEEKIKIITDIIDKNIGEAVLGASIDPMNFVYAFTHIMPFIFNISIKHVVINFYFFSNKVINVDYLESGSVLHAGIIDELDYRQLNEISKIFQKLNHQDIYDYHVIVVECLNTLINFSFDWNMHITDSNIVDYTQILQIRSSILQIFNTIIQSNYSHGYHIRISNAVKTLDLIANLIAGINRQSESTIFDKLCDVKSINDILKNNKNITKYSNVHEVLTQLIEKIHNDLLDFLNPLENFIKKNHPEKESKVIILQEFRHHYSHGPFMTDKKSKRIERFTEIMMQSNARVPDSIIFLPMLWMLAISSNPQEVIEFFR